MACHATWCGYRSRWRVSTEVRTAEEIRRSQGQDSCGQHLPLLLEGVHDAVGRRSNIVVIVERLDRD